MDHHNNIEEVAFTELDQTGTFDIFVGELPPDFGEGIGLLASVNDPISPEAVDARPRTVTWTELDALLEETPPDLILSGINEGENIGSGGAVSSGTVSAAVTGVLRSVPAIALSAGIDIEDESGSSRGIAQLIFHESDRVAKVEMIASAIAAAME